MSVVETHSMSESASRFSVLALDFDGVICASQREVFCTGLEAYARIEPGAGLSKELPTILKKALASSSKLEADPNFAAFCPLVPLGNRAEDFGVGLAAVDKGVVIADQEAYDRFFGTFDGEWLDRYHRAFYECRNERRERDVELWLSLHEPYPWFCDVLRRRNQEKVLAIATAKDARSVVLLLEKFRISELFPRHLILDKDTGVQKTQHLRVLSERLQVPTASISFVDDKVNHLENVQPLGVRPVLAGWGYNTSREHDRARNQGFDVATEDTAEDLLFGE